MPAARLPREPDWRWRFSANRPAAQWPLRATAAGRSVNQRSLRAFTAFNTTNLLLVATVVQLPKIFFSLWK
ncbi:Uncharacterised protein [Raoultella terrigena]|uniref:Uncharacterized protein n=1 Tax=Raoultella terrigena TaxID=577 RepID=A0A4U9D2L0_RAOTE|nr:Uncharacterised protein [Raoultella terrigena]